MNSGGPPDRFTATPDPVSTGSDLTIGFENASLANQDVTIKVFDGNDTDSITIHLDANGQGSATWEVPDTAITVILSQETSADHTVGVL